MAQRLKLAIAVLLTGVMLMGYTAVSSGAATPTATPVPVKYVVKGAAVGSGTAVRFDGQMYISLGAVKTLTGDSLKWNPQTGAISNGSAKVSEPVKAGTYLEVLPGQPYFVASSALCWQVSVDNKVGPVHSIVNQGAVSYPCNLVLPREPAVAGQHYTHGIAVLVSATGGKTSASNNSVTMGYDLGGHYLRFSGSIGLIDNLNRSSMEVTLTGDGKVLGTAVVPPGSLPASFNVSVAHVQQLSVRISDVSGSAPHWNEPLINQYSPGAVAIINPRLSA